MNAVVPSEAVTQLLDLYHAGERSFVGRQLRDCSLNNVTLIGADFSRSDLEGANFDGACLQGAIFRHAKLSGARFVGANLEGTDLSSADLSRSNLTDAWAPAAHFDCARLVEARLERAILTQTIFVKAQMEDATFDLADLRRADFSNSNLKASSLQGSDLRAAVFSDACLAGAKLQSAVVVGAIFANADLHGASVGNTIFGRQNLALAQGLATLKHREPSSLSIDLLRDSRGSLPGEFLRGCGLADWEIEASKLYDVDLTPAAYAEIQYKVFDLHARRPILISPLFISYSSADSDFVDRLTAEFDELGIRYWRDKRDAEAGPLDKVIERGMQLNPTVLVVLSEQSVGSAWVEHEIDIAVELSRKLKRHVLCPIALDDSWQGSRISGQLHTQIKKYNVLKFPERDDETAFRMQLKKLLSGLELHYAKPR